MTGRTARKGLRGAQIHHHHLFSTSDYNVLCSLPPCTNRRPCPTRTHHPHPWAMARLRIPFLRKRSKSLSAL
jgi:hypothetical protein